jgi:hypothetical protein
MAAGTPARSRNQVFVHKQLNPPHYCEPPTSLKPKLSDQIVLNSRCGFESDTTLAAVESLMIFATKILSFLNFLTRKSRSSARSFLNPQIRLRRRTHVILGISA